MNTQGASGSTNPVNSKPPDPAAEAARILKEAQAEYDELLLVETIKEDAEKKVDQQKKLRNLLVLMNSVE
jgi:hypothetical protein